MADNQFLIKRFLGDWIVQNTIYSLSKECMETYIDKVYWSIISSKHEAFTNIIKRIKGKYDQVCLIEIKHQNINNKKYCLFLFNNMKKRGVILRLNCNFRILNFYSFTQESHDFFYIIYKDKGIEIKEKIHFINSNLKFVKSIIAREQCLVGIAFGSEIKIR